MSSKNGSTLFIIFSLQAGGTQRMLVNILNVVPFSNNKRVLYLYNYYPSIGLENQLDPNVKIYRCNKRGIAKHFFRFYYLIRIIHKEKVSRIVSFALNGAYYALLSRVFFPHKRIPIIYRMVSVYNELVYSRFVLVMKIRHFIYFNILCRYVNIIIGQSNFMSEGLVSQKRDLLKNKVITIPNLILTNRILSLSQESIELKGDYYLFIGRFSEEKNIFGIIEAYNQIAGKVSDKLVLIGDGILRSKIVLKIKSLNLDGRVLLLGSLDNPYKYLSKAKALVLFSRYEGLPNVILESMICRTVVIVSDFDGVEDVVIDRETGYIVGKGNVVQLSKIMESIGKNMNIQNSITAKGFVFANELSFQAIKKYTALIND